MKYLWLYVFLSTIILGGLLTSCTQFENQTYIEEMNKLPTEDETPEVTSTFPFITPTLKITEILPTATQNPTFPVFTNSGQSFGNITSFGLAIADVDLDGDEDIFITNFSGPSSLWLNDGNGSFTRGAQIFDIPESHDVGIADFNGDGYPDIFLLSHASPSKVFFNNGTGAFEDSQQLIGAGTDYPGMIVLGDVDNDGDVDAFISYYEISNRLWLNDGAGFFTKSDVEFGIDGNPGHMELMDFNGDSFLDLFLCMTDSPDQVLLNDGYGNFTNTNQLLGSNVGNDSAKSIDIDMDGDNDIVVANNQKGIRIWFNQDGTGQFSEVGDYFGDDISLPFTLLDADFDGDYDLVTTHQNDKVLLWLNDGNGNFIMTETIFENSRIGSIESSDLDGDGDFDIVFGKINGAGNNAIYINE